MAQAAAAYTAPDAETIQLLQDSAADFCQRRLGPDRLRGLRGATPPFERAAWAEMCELGWVGLLVPEAVGGLEIGALALGTICRELGRVVAPEPLIECAVAAAVLGQVDNGTEHLDGLLGGQQLITVASAEAAEFLGTEPGSPTATRVGSDYELSGVVRGVVQAASMDAVLVHATLDGASGLFFVPLATPGISCQHRPQADGGSIAEIELSAVQLSASALLAEGTTADQLLDRARSLARLASSAYLLGLTERVFDITLDYLRTREQFGRPIGSFQALQHRAVDLFIHKTFAGAVVEEALNGFDASTDAAARDLFASRAKYRANQAALQVARQAVQLHGGIGYTDECDVGLYLNRALVVSAQHAGSAFLIKKLGPMLAAIDNSGNNDEQLAVDINVIPNNGEWDTVSDEHFRVLIRHFFESEYPEDMRYPPRRHRWAEIKPWYLRLSEQGWVAPAWPAEHGGMGLSPSKMLIYIEEQERWGVGRAPDMGIQMVGPLLIRHGTDEQRRQYLPKILTGETIWCQGYSEPNAGSDLASLKTEAVADGDEFVINGQKTWTTLAQDATHMFCLARTSKVGKQQEGISFFLIDFDQPGITVRPIRNIAGDEEFCEVFLDNVRVPADCLVGEINQGWTIAKALLGFERIFIGSPKQSQYALMRLETIADAAGLRNDAAFADRLTREKLDVLDLETTYQRFADIVRRGEPLGPDVSLLKIWGTETFARISELMVETAGAEGATLGDIDFGDHSVNVMSQFYNARPATIYGGSNEIQRNIIAKGVLKLPG